MNADNEDSDQIARMCRLTLSLSWALMTEGTFSHVATHICHIRREITLFEMTHRV